MTSPEHLARVGWKPGTLKPGDKVTLVIHPMRDGVKGGQYLSGTGPGGPLIGSPQRRRAKANDSPRDSHIADGDPAGVPGDCGLHAGGIAGLERPVGKRRARRRMRQADSISRSIRFSRRLQWGPPNKPEVQARVDRMVSDGAQEAGSDRPRRRSGRGRRAPAHSDIRRLMLDSPLMFEVLPTPKETALIFSSREIRHVYTDGRQHTPKDELWATPWGDSIGHWEGQTLVIDTIAVKSAFGSSESEGVAVVAFGDVEGEQTITILSPQAHFIETNPHARQGPSGGSDDRHRSDQSHGALAHEPHLRTSGAHPPHGLRGLRGRGAQSDRQRPFHARPTAAGDAAAGTSAEQRSVRPS